MTSVIAPIVLEVAATAAASTKSSNRFLRKLRHPSARGLKRWVPIFGGKAVFELASMAIVFFIFIVSGFSVGGVSVGSVADVVAAMVMLFGMRLTQVRKVLQPEVIMFWHKFLAYLVAMLLLIHSIQVGMSGTGVGMAVVMLSTPLLFLAHKMGKVDYAWFFLYHATGAMALVPLAFLHGAIGLGVVGVGFYVDLVLRYVVFALGGTAQVIRVSEEAMYVELALNATKPLKIGPGQYFYLNLPVVSAAAYHPFSAIPMRNVSKSGRVQQNLQHFCFYVKRSGPWTSSLYGIGSDCALRAGEDTLGATNFPAKLEGPYGVISVDYADADLYPILLLVAGGIGVTPMLSVLADLVDKRSTRQKVVFVWTVRDADLAVDVSQRILRPLLQHEQYDPSAAAAAMVTTNVLHASSSSKSPLMDDSGRDVDPAELDVSPSGLQLETRFFYSGDAASTAAEELRRAGWCRGRPCLSEIVRTAVEQTPASTATKRAERPRAAVVVCGPEALVEEVRDLCDHEVYVSRASGERVVVDCHEESFSG